MVTDAVSWSIATAGAATSVARVAMTTSLLLVDMVVLLFGPGDARVSRPVAGVDSDADARQVGDDRECAACEIAQARSAQRDFSRAGIIERLVESSIECQSMQCGLSARAPDRF